MLNSPTTLIDPLGLGGQGPGPGGNCSGKTGASLADCVTGVYCMPFMGACGSTVLGGAPDPFDFIDIGSTTVRTPIYAPGSTPDDKTITGYSTSTIPGSWLLLSEPVGPNGQLLPPPIPLPPGRNGQPNGWRPVPGSPNRPTKWVPTYPVPSPQGGQPSASWDDQYGHWDYDNGLGERTRFDPNGSPVTHPFSIAPNVMNIGVGATVAGLTGYTLWQVLEDLIVGAALAF